MFWCRQIRLFCISWFVRGLFLVIKIAANWNPYNVIRAIQLSEPQAKREWIKCLKDNWRIEERYSGQKLVCLQVLNGEVIKKWRKYPRSERNIVFCPTVLSAILKRPGYKAWRHRARVTGDTCVDFFSKNKCSCVHVVGIKLKRRLHL